MSTSGDIVVSVLERTVSTAAALVERPPAGCGLVEIRADRFGAADVAALVPRCPLPTVVTARRPEDGGEFRGSEEERRALLLAALQAGADFVDVEWGSPVAGLLRGPVAGRGILSHHGGPCSVDRLRDLRRAMAAEPAARLKIVPVAGRIGDLGAIRDVLAERGGPPLACFATGRAGVLSRLLALRWGSWGTYGAVSTGRETAAGQLTVADLEDRFGVRSIGPRTVLHGLVGRDLEWSPSPAMHAVGYRSAGLDARYLPVELDRFDDVDALLDRDGPIGLAGFGVTVPYKVSARGRCTDVDDWAEATGAVNTVVPRGDVWSGFNTDAEAARRLLGPLGSLSGRRALVLGAGGTARSMAVVLRSLGASVALCNRDPGRARAVASEIGAEVVPWSERHGIRPDVLVQATPLGRSGETAVERNGLPGLAVLDAAYGPEPTPLVRSARHAGLPTVDGLDLLVAQGVLQFRHLTGHVAQEPEFRDAAERFLRRRRGEG